MTSQTPSLRKRVRCLNEAPLHSANARYVLYWMQVYKRPTYNHALNYAVELANELNLPVVVYEGLKYYYPWANDRLHTFILEGVEEKRTAFAKQGIRYAFYLQATPNDPRDTLARLSADAAAVVSDDFPCFIIPGQTAKLIPQIKLPLYVVDSNGLIPLDEFEKEEYAAYTIRPKINRLKDYYLQEDVLPPEFIKVNHPSPDLSLNLPEETRSVSDIPSLVAKCQIDHTVPPSSLYHGGNRAAHRRLQRFVTHILPRYHQTRNEPSVDGTSRLSSYLHFGFLSVYEVIAAVKAAEAPTPAKASYLEELIVRRELSYNLTRFNPEYTSLKSLPDWARKTMHEHENDPRPEIYSPERIEAAETGDEMWNATQRELLRTGEIHNYVRMLWGKLVIAWRPTYAEAFEVLEHLNNKYGLDGRNPNSYAGILWCFGKHDRAWGERPIYGKLRYMTSASMRKKIDATKYIAWTQEFN